MLILLGISLGRINKTNNIPGMAIAKPGIVTLKKFIPSTPKSLATSAPIIFVLDPTSVVIPPNIPA